MIAIRWFFIAVPSYKDKYGHTTAQVSYGKERNDAIEEPA